jgi:HAE1 family hydrophobic/amphiphilic exporter-1
VSRITELAVKNRSVTILLTVAILIAGVYSWGSLKQELLPDIEFPVITVVAPYPGAGAADVTEQVTRPIERAVSGIPRLERLQSTSANSLGLVVAQFSYGTNVKDVRATIEQNLQAAGLPPTVSPSVTSLNINATPVIVASISASDGTSLEDVARIVQTQVVPEVQALEGVNSAEATGGETRRIEITLDPAKLTEAGISTSQISGVLQANNITFPAGSLPLDGQSVPVSTIHAFDSADEISNLIVGVKGLSTGAGTGTIPGAGTGTIPGAGTGTVPGAGTIPGAGTGTGTVPGAGGTAAVPTPVRLGDLGTVEAADVATTGFARTDGQPSLTLTVSKNADANTVTVADEVSAKLEELKAANPGLNVVVVSDLSAFIKESRDGLVKEGLLGAAMAIIVIFLFLLSIRSTFVAAISIPTSILAALTLMLVAGISINIMTLGGLAVAVGRVVDDAIVVLENIYRHRARGDDRLTAVLSGAREVASAITSSTITTVAVFLPLGFVGGLVSQFFLPFALTVTFALLASLVVALTVVPVLAYFLVDRVKMDVDEDGEPRKSIWIRAYTPTITLALRSRWTKWGVLGIATALFVGSLALVPGIPTQFINAGSEKVLVVNLAPPSGTPSAAVLDRAIEAEGIIRADEQVTLIQTTVPSEGDTGFQTVNAAFTGRAANSAVITVRLSDEANLSDTTEKLLADLEPIKDGGWDVTVGEQTGFSSSGLNVIVSGPDSATVADATEQVLDAIRDQPDIVNLKSDLTKGAPAVEVLVDPNKAIAAGLTTAQVAGEVRGVLSGSQVGRIQTADGPVLDLYMRIDPTAVASVEALKALPVGTFTKVPLSAIADVNEVSAQGSITRIDGAPASSITAQITSKDQGGVSRAVQLKIDELKAAGTLPAGVDVRLAGVTQQQNSAFGGLFASMGVAILLVYICLVLTFNSLITPFIILFSLPLATIGAFAALYITGRPIGISALIGFLMLIGIVVTNAIVLLDLVERLRERGEPTTQALIEGGRTRVRPILMTALATILALMPLGLGLNEGSIIASELATVVIGGLLSSTFLTLIVVPVVYSLVDGGKSGLSRRFRRGGAGEPAPAALEPAPAPAAPAGA